MRVADFQSNVLYAIEHLKILMVLLKSSIPPIPQIPFSRTGTAKVTVESGQVQNVSPNTQLEILRSAQAH